MNWPEAFAIVGGTWAFAAVLIAAVRSEFAARGETSVTKRPRYNGLSRSPKPDPEWALGYPLPRAEPRAYSSTTVSTSQRRMAPRKRKAKS